MRIVALPAGWVFVGEWNDRGDEIVLLDAICVRKWGTKQGLGQLALQGPQKETVLDPAGTVRFKKGSEIFSLMVQKWL